VVSGKQERFIKDNEAMNAFLLTRAVEKKSVYLHGHESPLPSEQLIHLLKVFSRYEEWLERQNQKGMPKGLVEQVIKTFSTGQLSPADQESMSVVKEELEKAGYEVSSIEVEEEQRGYDLELRQSTNGHERIRLKYEFLQSVEFKKLLELYNQIGIFHLTPYSVKDAQGEVEFEHPRALFQYLMEEARKGLAIQRYKGLGEMNPEQLWETTMNPEKRTLLQVRIEDQYLADELFTTLMGDRVEPRRDFIQYNALDFRDLDI
jgi:DNA gyrase subunit B